MGGGEAGAACSPLALARARVMGPPSGRLAACLSAWGRSPAPTADLLGGTASASGSASPAGAPPPFPPAVAARFGAAGPLARLSAFAPGLPVRSRWDEPEPSEPPSSLLPESDDPESDDPSSRPGLAALANSGGDSPSLRRRSWAAHASSRNRTGCGWVRSSSSHWIHKVSAAHLVTLAG